MPERILEEIDGDESEADYMNEGKKEEVKQSDQKLERKKFDFLYKRTCFRLMGEYYKLIFNNSCKGKKVSRHYKQFFLNFAGEYFHDLLSEQGSFL